MDCFRYHFAGAVHDYLSGMLSIRHDGESLPEIIGRYLGLPTKQLMRGFTVVLMILVGAVLWQDLPDCLPNLLRSIWMLLLDYCCVFLLYVGYIVAGR